jgi:nicotinamidase-related amidase
MSSKVLLIVDMISDYAFPDAERLEEAAGRAVPCIRRARDVADAAGLSVVYVTDIQDRWQCSPDVTVAAALEGRRPDLVEPLLPRSHDPFLHKGQHSAFYGTPLAHLLHETQADEVVLTGQVTDQCVLYTALDAHVRHYEITVLRDAVVDMDPDLGDAAVRMMEENMGARIVGVDDWRAQLSGDPAASSPDR